MTATVTRLRIHGAYEPPNVPERKPNVCVGVLFAFAMCAIWAAVTMGMG